MDPNDNLEEQLRAAERIIGCVDDCVPIEDEDALRLAELVQSLNEWISNGGFLPQNWRP